MAATRSSLSFAQRVRIMEFLRDKLETIEIEGKKFAQYRDTWNDALIGQHCGCSTTNVASVRREIYGDIRGKHSTDVEMASELQSLREVVLNLGGQVTLLRDRVNLLEECLK